MSMSCEEMIRQLQEIFPNKSVSTIQYVMDIVNTERPMDEDDYKFETAFNLLSETGNASDEEQLFNEAVGGQPVPNANKEKSVDVCLEDLIEVFPDCKLSFLQAIVEKHLPNFNFDDVVDELSLSAYSNKG